MVGVSESLESNRAVTKPMKKPVTKTRPAAYPTLLTGIGVLLEESRRAVVRAANCFMTATYWEVGRRIVEFEQRGKRRADYGEELLKQLAVDLTARHGRGFSERNLEQMRRFYESRPISQTLSAKLSRLTELAISQTVSAKSISRISTTGLRSLPDDTLSLVRTLAARFPLPWSHYVKLLTVKDVNARRFYEDEALRGGWSVRQLDRQISSLFYERTLLSKDKAAMLRKGAKPQPGEVVRDPLVLEFLSLRRHCPRPLRTRHAAKQGHRTGIPDRPPRREEAGSRTRRDTEAAGE
jgi:hypothetical protein